MLSEEKKTHMVSAVKNFLVDDSGASLVEYGMLLALIAVVCFGAVTALGGSVQTMFQNVATDI